jgi:hypothetical protein
MYCISFLFFMKGSAASFGFAVSDEGKVVIEAGK